MRFLNRILRGSSRTLQKIFCTLSLKSVRYVMDNNLRMSILMSSLQLIASRSVHSAFDADRSIWNAIIHRTSFIDVDFCWQCWNAAQPRNFPSFPFTRDVNSQHGTGAYRRWRIFCAETNREILLLLRHKFEHNVAIEREFWAPFDDFGLELHSSRRFHIMTRIANSAIVDSVFSSPEHHLKTFSWLEP